MSAPTAEDVYNNVVIQLPVPERFRLANLILEHFSPGGIDGYSEEWTDEDIRDATLHSLRHADDSLGEEMVDAAAR